MTWYIDDRAALLAAIRPQVAAPGSDRFSRNLFNWLRRAPKRPACRVYVTQQAAPDFGCPDPAYHPFHYEPGRGDIFLGHLFDDGWLHAAQLATILTGVDRRTWAMMPTHVGWPLDVTGWFWRKYLAHGRCFLHPDHPAWIGNGEARWRYRNAGERECQWCGEVQALGTVTRVAQRWLPVAQVREAVA